MYVLCHETGVKVRAGVYVNVYVYWDPEERKGEWCVYWTRGREGELMCIHKIHILYISVADQCGGR